MNKQATAQIESRFKPSSVILTDDDLLLIHGANKYKKTIEEQCENLLKKTQAQCDQMYKDTQNACDNLQKQKAEEMHEKLNSLSDQLKQENYALIRKFCTTIEENIFVMCYKTLAKLHITATTNQQLLKLIQEEISEYTQDKQITIQANEKNVAYLQETLNLQNKKISYLQKDTLDDGQCILSDGFTTVHVDLEKCGDNILQLLNETINNRE